MEKSFTIDPVTKIKGKIMQYMLNGTIDWNAGCRLRNALDGPDREVLLRELWSSYVKDYPEET